MIRTETRAAHTPATALEMSPCEPHRWEWGWRWGHRPVCGLHGLCLRTTLASAENTTGSWEIGWQGSEHRLRSQARAVWGGAFQTIRTRDRTPRRSLPQIVLRHCQQDCSKPHTIVLRVLAWMGGSYCVTSMQGVGVWWALRTTRHSGPMFYVLRGFLICQCFFKITPIDTLAFCWITYLSIFIFTNNRLLALLIFCIVLFLVFVILG